MNLKQQILDKVHKAFETKLAGRKMINFNVFTDPFIRKQHKFGFYCWGEVLVDDIWQQVVYSDEWSERDASLYDLYPENILDDICKTVEVFYDTELQLRYNRCEILHEQNQ